MLSPEPLDELVGDAVASLKTGGVTPEQMQALLNELSIELVLTAHPTEARRRTVTSKIQRVARLLDDIQVFVSRRGEREKTRSAIHAEMAVPGSPIATAPYSLLSQMRCDRFIFCGKRFLGCGADAV